MTSTATAVPVQRAAPIFGSVLCGIDASRADAEATRQAAILAGPDARLELLSVTYEAGVGETAQVLVSHSRARRALGDAHELAIAAGAKPTERMIDGGSDTDALLAQAAGWDLLVVGDHGLGRVEGMVLGSTASTAVHRAPCPVLIARGTPEPSDFPGCVLLADDGTGASEEAVRLAVAIAGRFGSELVLATPDGLDRHDVAATVLTVDGPAHEAIPRLAREAGASLVILGTRGLKGLHALASVSERVAGRFAGSVLVVRHPSSKEGVSDDSASR